jgi:hypothetical protein
MAVWATVVLILQLLCFSAMRLLRRNTSAALARGDDGGGDRAGNRLGRVRPDERRMPELSGIEVLVILCGYRIASDTRRSITMPDTTVEPGGSGPYDRPVEARVSRLEEQMSDLKPILARIEAVLPHLATAAQVAELKGDLEWKFAEFTGTIELKQAEFAGSMDSKLAQVAGSMDSKLAQFAGSMDSKLAQFAGSMESKLAQFAGSMESKLAQFAGSMESKQAQFAGSMESKQAQFAGDFNAKLERLTGRVESLPTTWQMITAIIAGQITFAGVLCAAVFGAARLTGHL